MYKLNKQTKKNMKKKQQASSVRLIEFDLNVDWSFPESIIALINCMSCLTMLTMYRYKPNTATLRENIFCVWKVFS